MKVSLITRTQNSRKTYQGIPKGVASNDAHACTRNTTTIMPGNVNAGNKPIKL